MQQAWMKKGKCMEMPCPLWNVSLQKPPTITTATAAHAQQSGNSLQILPFWVATETLLVGRNEVWLSGCKCDETKRVQPKVDKLSGENRGPVQHLWASLCSIISLWGLEQEPMEWGGSYDLQMRVSRGISSWPGPNQKGARRLEFCL